MWPTNAKGLLPPHKRKHYPDELYPSKILGYCYTSRENDLLSLGKVPQPYSHDFNTVIRI